MDPNDFARLFRLDDVGQVLVTIEQHEEDETPCLKFRIPDADGVGLSVTLSYNFREGLTYAEQCSHVWSDLSKIDEAKLREVAGGLIQMRTFMLEGTG